MREHAPVVVQHSVEVSVAPERAFEVYTAGINQWWKRGTNYWNDRNRAVGLRFEPFVGGRFLEVYDEATGEGFEIGRVTDWQPGRRLAYTWREQGWAAAEQCEVEVLFDRIEGGTRVTLVFAGWERIARGKEMAEGYAHGARELLGWFAEALVGAPTGS